MQRDGHRHSLWQDTTKNVVNGMAPAADALFDVLIVGAGITGITTALALTQGGLRCAVLEARNVGFGTTGGTTAHLNTVLDFGYDRVAKNFGVEAARTLASGLTRAMGMITTNVAQHAPDCGHSVVPSYTFSATDKENEALQDLMDATRAAGIPTEEVATLPIARTFKSVMRVPNQAQFHPGRYVHGLAKAYTALGGTLLERCRVTGVEEGDVITATTDQGVIRAKKLIYATHIPPGVNVLHFRCAPYRSYVLSVKLSDEAKYPDALVYDMEEPYHYYRTQHIDGQPYLIVGGEDHKTGHEENTDARLRALEAHVRTHFPVAEVTHAWSSQYFEPTDGLPYIGGLPGGGENMFVATGFGGNGMMLGTLAAIALCDHLLRGDTGYTKLFDPKRVSVVAGFASFAKEAADVVGHLLATPFLPDRIEGAEELAPGEGRLVRMNGEAMGLFKDEDARLHGVSLACSHIKCTVAWNSAERSWDCPCHGSRFDVDGAMLTGPARKDLLRVVREGYANETEPAQMDEAHVLASAGHATANPLVSSHGVPGFHNKRGEDGTLLAGMELDADTDPARVDTGTGDQPSNTGGSRFTTATGIGKEND